jgi:hypothetical protein
MEEKPVGQERRYLAYLLRLWQEGAGDLAGGEPSLWRASLQTPQSEEVLGFAGLGDLVAFLERETGSGSPGLDSSESKGQ